MGSRAGHFTRRSIALRCCTNFAHDSVSSVDSSARVLVAKRRAITAQRQLAIHVSSVPAYDIPIRPDSGCADAVKFAKNRRFRARGRAWMIDTATWDGVSARVESCTLATVSGNLQ
jgi:hypothetical protein